MRRLLRRLQSVPNKLGTVSAVVKVSFSRLFVCTALLTVFLTKNVDNMGPFSFYFLARFTKMSFGNRWRCYSERRLDHEDRSNHERVHFSSAENLWRNRANRLLSVSTSQSPGI